MRPIHKRPCARARANTRNLDFYPAEPGRLNGAMAAADGRRYTGRSENRSQSPAGGLRRRTGWVGARPWARAAHRRGNPQPLADTNQVGIADIVGADERAVADPKRTAMSESVSPADGIPLPGSWRPVWLRRGGRVGCSGCAEGVAEAPLPQNRGIHRRLPRRSG